MASPIYSKIEYESAFASKKNLLEAQLSFLNSAKNIESYRQLRKKELLLKLKLKNNLKNIREGIIKLNAHLPKTSGFKELKEKKLPISEKSLKKSHSIEGQLFEIQDKLRQLQ